MGRKKEIIGYVVAEIKGETTYWAEVEPDSYVEVKEKPSQGDDVEFPDKLNPMRITKRGIAHAVLGGVVIEEEHWQT